MTSKVKPIRFPNVLLADIERNIVDSDMADQYGAFSKWVKNACKDSLLREKGINEQLLDELVRIRRNLDGIGNNINQLARKANAGENVNLHDGLVDALIGSLKDIRSETLRPVLALGSY